MALTEVLPDLHVFEDTCNVYILRDGVTSSTSSSPLTARPSTEPSAYLDELDGRLHRLLEHIPYRIGPAAGMRFAHEAPMAQLSEHLLWSDEVTCSNF